jgi:hypothetical protein
MKYNHDDNVNNIKININFNHHLNNINDYIAKHNIKSNRTIKKIK